MARGSFLQKRHFLGLTVELYNQVLLANDSAWNPASNPPGRLGGLRNYLKTQFVILSAAKNLFFLTG
jgi:hypothetical protein